MLRAVMADANIEGQIEAVFDKIIYTPRWIEIWESFGLEVVTLESLGIDRTTPDDVVWRICQTEQILLITDNRNHDGPDSLEATIQRENSPSCIPILTVGDAEELRTNWGYAERVAELILDRIMFIDNHLGAGRLYIP